MPGALDANMREFMTPIRDTQKKLQDLKSVLSNARRVLIVTHDNPDPDCVATAAVFELIFSHMDKEVAVTSGGELGRTENKTLQSCLNLKILPVHEVDSTDYDFFFFVDTQPGSGNNSYVLPKDARYGILDHHIMGEDWPSTEPVFSDIRENYGATATLAYEYLLARNVKANSEMSTALYYAIRTETSDMGRGACKADHAVYQKLHSKIDWDLLHKIVHSKVSADYFVMMKDAVERALRYGRALVVDLGPTRHSDFVGEVADSFMRLDDVDWVLVWGWLGNRIVFSIRNALDEPHVGRLARELVVDFGSAGGHRHMAGGQVSFEPETAEDTRLKFRRSVIPAFLDSVNQPTSDGLPLF
jgi:nanoRNase/pAp phosphatase (c-di-AMP/oligoRNAs hydrolase)